MFVMMAARPWRPAVELEGALERGDLHYAITLAHELRDEQGQPIDLLTAARFLPLIARESPGEYDTYALRWLLRWLGERPRTIELTAEVATQLADLPAEPSLLEAIKISCQPGTPGRA